MPVDPSEAPEGFEAVDSIGCASCSGCAFNSFSSVRGCRAFKCMPWARNDGMNVIFVPRTTKPATANFPHDDMGTPV